MSQVNDSTKVNELDDEFTHDVDPDNPDILLFSEQEIGGFTVRPLTFGQFAKISGRVALLAKKIRTDFADDDFSFEAVLTAIAMHLHECLPIVAFVADTTVEELEKLPPAVGLQLTLAVWNMNMDTFVNFINLGRTVHRQ